jgi:hypothetical protein
MAAARKPKTLFLRLWRRSLPGERVRLQFVNVKTRRVLFSSVFQRGLLAICEREAKKDSVCLAQFLINAIVSTLHRRERQASQGIRRAV